MGLAARASPPPASDASPPRLAAAMQGREQKGGGGGGSLSNLEEAEVAATLWSGAMAPCISRSPCVRLPSYVPTPTYPPSSPTPLPPPALARQYGGQVGTVAVLTPYRAQLQVLRTAFRRWGGDPSGVEVRERWGWGVPLEPALRTCGPLLHPPPPPNHAHKHSCSLPRWMGSRGERQTW